MALIEIGLDEFTDTELTRECKARGIIPKDGPRQDDAKREDAIEQARYEYDTLIHDLRAAFLARDAAHLEVLLTRMDVRYREVVPA